jgi:uncharacterized protein YkwD
MQKILALVLLVLAGLVIPWQPAHDLAVEAATNPPFAIGYTVAKPSPVRAGTNATLETRIQARAAGTATIVVSVSNGSSTLWSTSWPNQSFAAWQSRAYITQWAAPSGLAAGYYWLNVHVRNGAGRDLVTPKVVRFSVAAPLASPSPTSTRPPAPTATPTAPPAPTATPIASPTGLDPEEAAFLALVNQYRQFSDKDGNGQPKARCAEPLQIHSQLTAAARWHSYDMAVNRYFSHVDSLGRDPGVRLAAFGYRQYWGEIIAAGYWSGADVFNGWKNSDGHDAIMINCAYRYIGIGRVTRDSVPGSFFPVYWSVSFGD